MGTNTFVDDPTRQCVGKFKFATKARAKVFLKRAREMSGRGDVMPYHCPHCGFFHLGTKPGVKARRRAKASQMRYTESNTASTATGGGASENST